MMAVMLAVFGACTVRNTDGNGAALTDSAAAVTVQLETAVTSVTDQDIDAEEATGTFELTTEDGAFTVSGNVYTISAAGTYTATGLLEGQLVVSAGEDDEVVLELSGATITCGTDSPIKVISAGKVEISAKKGTENVINDTRSAKKHDSEGQGAGAIWADCDL